MQHVCKCKRVNIMCTIAKPEAPGLIVKVTKTKN